MKRTFFAVKIPKHYNFSTLKQLETPSVLIDKQILIKNIKNMQKISNKHKLKLRPHIKTHKCVEIAKIQQQEGSVGISCSKHQEALVFLESGFNNITVTHPLIDENKILVLLQKSNDFDSNVNLTFDSMYGLSNIERVANKIKKKIPIFLKIDVGLNRCGVDPEDTEKINQIIEFIKNSQYLEFMGLISHAGNSYMAKDKEAVLEVAKKEIDILNTLHSKMLKKIFFKEISIGSTPTCLVSDYYKNITEIRPGNYVFNDKTPLRLDLIEKNEIALSVLSTVVSENQNYYIIDSGSKTLTSDSGGHGSSSDSFGDVFKLDDFPNKNEFLKVNKLSEEHGWISKPKEKIDDFAIGSKCRIIPNHSCPISNLIDEFVIVENGMVIDRWKVNARGKAL
eukprot:gene12282-5865_t